MLSKRLLSSLYRVEDGRLISRLTNREAGSLGTGGRYVIIFDEHFYADEIIQILNKDEE